MNFWYKLGLVISAGRPLSHTVKEEFFLDVNSDELNTTFLYKLNSNCAQFKS